MAEFEIGENTSKGGTLDKISNIIFVGDDAKDRQYRGILSFDTSSLPDDATITSAQVKMKRQGVVGTDPFNTHGNLLLEIRNGAFSNSTALNIEDFSAIANIGSTRDPFSGAVSNWHTASLSNINLGLVNKSGVTQFRLLFSKDDNDDMGADYVKLFSGNSATDQPQLIVTYSTVSGGATNQPPVITSNGGGATADISLPENMLAVTTVAATDPDAQSLTYSIIGGADAALFNLDPASGKLYFITPPSYNAPNNAGLDHVYNVTVQVSDGSLTDSQELVVSITHSKPPTGGILDPSFGSNGVVTTKVNGVPTSASEILLQPDGKVVTLGTVKVNVNQPQRIISRYNINGTLDASFGSNGSIIIDALGFPGTKIGIQTRRKADRWRTHQRRICGHPL